MTLAEHTRKVILDTLEAHNGCRRCTAKVLNIALKTVYNHLTRYQGSEPGLQVRTSPDCQKHKDGRCTVIKPSASAA